MEVVILAGTGEIGAVAADAIGALLGRTPASRPGRHRWRSTTSWRRAAMPG
jgi:hypothetical protein